MVGLAPIALTACVEGAAATAPPTSAAPSIGVDLGTSTRVRHIAGLAGEGEGYGRTEPAPVSTAHVSMIDHGSMGHGSMSGMSHGSTDRGSMSGMSHASMDHGSMPGMSHGSMGHGSTGDGSKSVTSRASSDRTAKDHGSMTGMRNAAGSGSMQVAQSGQAPAQGTGTVNSVDATARKININHDPIPAIGWPAMTMDFAVAPTVDLRAVKPGARVNFQMMQGQGGMYVIQSVTPVGGGR